MAMGRRKAKQQDLCVSTEAIPKPASHPFYAKVSQILNERRFDHAAENAIRGTEELAIQFDEAAKM